ncbi:SPX domain-containing protein [Phycomyces nitens]|nr:SPX domain-containing protein [Phycomyces nitens]
MKFAKQLETESVDIPSAWRPYLIQYRTLKKLVAKVADEIEDRGLSASFLRETLCKDSLDQDANDHPSVPKIHYYFTGEPPNVRPCIEFTYNSHAPRIQKILTRLKDKRFIADDNQTPNEVGNETQVINITNSLKDNSPSLEYKGSQNDIDFFSLSRKMSNASIRPEIEYKGTQNDTDFFSISRRGSHSSVQIEEDRLSRRESDTAILIKELMNLAVHDHEKQHMLHAITEEGLNIKEIHTAGPEEMESDDEEEDGDPRMKTLVLELAQDDEFFYTLMMEMDQASELQTTTSDKFKLDIDGLESQMVKAASPQEKDDMYTWREIFSVYMDAQIFKGKIEADRTMRSVQKSKQQMAWFTTQIQSKRLNTKFKSKTSKTAFEQFIRVNNALITMKHYQALNHTAMTKILKKHDKRSGLTASQSFPEIVKVKRFFDQKMAHILCALLTDKLISIILQPEDFSCPVCMWVAWRPIRLVCGHVFCVRCLIKQQRARMDSCPVCRHPTAVKLASAVDLDLPRQNLLKQYFPKEIKQKRRENEREQAIEDVQAMTGRIYTEEQLMQMQRNPNGKCSIM